VMSEPGRRKKALGSVGALAEAPTQHFLLPPYPSDMEGATSHACKDVAIGQALTDTEDVIQDIFVRAWEKLDTFRGDAPFGAWLHKLGVNVLLRYRERLRARQDRFLNDEAALQSAPAPAAGLQLYTEIESAIWRLPQRVREVLVLHDMEGYRHREIAELLGISAATSRWHAHAGRLMLQEYLE
jgi:RNA polymerase sigma-70 factor (ECF subfamily)